MKLTPKKLAFALLLFGAIGVILAIAFWPKALVWPEPPAGVRIFEETKRVSVSGRDPLEWKNGYQMKQFIKLRSGEIVAPILQVQRQRRSGFMGAIRTDIVLEDTFHYLGGRRPKIEIPIADDIDRFVLLVRRLDGIGQLGTDPWRYWEASPEDIDDGFTMPHIETLELFDDRKDAAELLDKEKRLGRYENRNDRSF